MAVPSRATWPSLLPERLLRGIPERWLADLGDLEDLLEGARLRLEEFRDDDTLVIRAEMPGIDPDKDVEITVENGDLCIRAERRQRTEDKGDGSYRSEFQYGRFSRRLALPPGASAEDVTASYTDGILEIRVPLGKEAPGATKVPVTRGGSSG